jgi:hypothetical protein
MMHKRKRTNKSKKGIFWAVTIDTTNKGSRPEIHAHVGGKSWLDYRIFMHHIELVDTTNKGLLLAFTMMNF